MAQVTCPTCQRRVEYSPDNKWRPFCSERCKLIDLGEWAAEKHAIPAIDEHDNANLDGSNEFAGMDTPRKTP